MRSSFLSEVESFALSSLPLEYEKPFSHAFRGGKRVRPSFLFDVCRFLDMDPFSMIPAAAAIELIHASSLIHDDVVDHDVLRRNDPSFSSRFGTNQAVLFGDFLMTHALEIVLNEFSRVQMVQDTVSVLQEMIRSQLLEQNDQIVNEEAYWNYVHGKTASLFGLCARLPLSVMNSKNAEVVPFAHAYGVAFQLADDLSEESWENEPNIQHFLSKENALALLSDKKEELGRKGIVPLENLVFAVPVSSSKLS